MSSSSNSSLNDGIAMQKRITTGISVQATSIRVLWVVLEGTGLDLALNFTTTMTSSASTNRVMMVMSQNRKLWNKTMTQNTGAAIFFTVYSPGACRPQP